MQRLDDWNAQSASRCKEKVRGVVGADYIRAIRRKPLTNFVGRHIDYLDTFATQCCRKSSVSRVTFVR